MHSPLKSIRSLNIVLSGLAFCLSLTAQTTTGRILGSVRDVSGAPLAGATVTVTDTQRDTTRTVLTDDSGAYAVSNLVPGTYSVRAEAPGFKTLERDEVQIEVASDFSVDLALPPGEVRETIVVSAEVPLVNATSATLGGTLDNEEINDLPLNGRNYENLLQLRPGVVRYPGGGFSTTSTNGLRAEDNAYLVDGLFNSEPFSGQSIINGAGIAGDSATILPVDAIQEFNVQQNPRAEYGWKPGAIINVGLKSGTNELHGTAYAFGRDTPFDARNFFNTVDSGPKNPRQSGAIRRHGRRRHRQGQAFLLRWVRGAALHGGQQQSDPDLGHGSTPQCRQLHLQPRGRLRQQHPERHRRRARRVPGRGDPVRCERGQPEDRRLQPERRRAR